MVILPKAVVEKFEAKMELPEGIVYFGGNGYINFAEITIEQAERLVAANSPYLRKKQAETVVEQPTKQPKN